jgi:hypothetical protein
MDHIAHGAEPDNQQAADPRPGFDVDMPRLDITSLETHGRLGNSRERIISLVE